MKPKPCNICGNQWHSAYACKDNPKAVEKHKETKRKMTEKQIAKQSIKKAPVKKKKTVAKKTQTRSQLVKKLDTIFSQYIRLLYADEFGYAKCVTCPISRHWTEQQNGHYESRRHLPTRWLVDNCHVQGVECNVFKKGNYTEYALYMINRYGVEKLDELKKLANSGEKITTPWVREQIGYYTAEVARLKLEKNL